jgi:hypothetical protein
VRACVHKGECLYVYEYLRLYCVSKKIDRECIYVSLYAYAKFA